MLNWVKYQVRRRTIDMLIELLLHCESFLHRGLFILSKATMVIPDNRATRSTSFFSIGYFTFLKCILVSSLIIVIINVG